MIVFAITIQMTTRSSHQRCSVRKGVLRNFAKFTGKHLCQVLFYNWLIVREKTLQIILKFVLISNCCFSWINPYLELNFISTDSVITREINSWYILFTCRLFLFIFEKLKFILNVNILYFSQYQRRRVSLRFLISLLLQNNHQCKDFM